ncbi:MULTISPECIES: ABC transporter permease [Antrihabitans]|jgi:ABC-2 type transport system permease protein|uniref:Transport permease protein n=2 Tax=Antrihabitans TaxID=2799491 RepID=A0A934U3A6_9NOCA|nr:ABC transporter permease [Antrihabitans stalagmiti]MBJ8339540.1 ABC transporter permease [Antrihabitans stalagmiti]
MSVRITLNTVGRVLTQIWHDRRTLAVLLLVPCMLLTLLRFIFDGRPDIFDQIGLMLLGIFPFVSMFLVTSVAMLRERVSGTLERLLSTPVQKLDLLFGYGIAFALVAIIQASVASAVTYGLLGLRSQGSVAVVILIAASTAVLGSSTGLLTSAFAKSEFQALQFMPAIVVPQILLCGLIWPREEMSGALQALSNVMPLRYAAEALREVETYPLPTDLMWRDLAVIVVFALLLIAGGAATLRRRTA